MRLAVAEFPEIDALLATYASALGDDFVAYRNHVTRMTNFVFAIEPRLRDDAQLVFVAAAFHDLGIWTDHTFDYLAPSERLARAYLSSHDMSDRIDEVMRMIEEHHKVRRYTGPFARSVDAFRRADLVDLTFGAVSAGIDAHFIRAVRSAFPNTGFHARLISLTAREFVRNPLRPVPVVRL